MAVDKKLIIVVGATGLQGGGVVNALLKSGRFTVRGLTRDTSKSSAKALASRGVELVKADLTKPASLAKAFAGAYGVFIVTSYMSAGSKAAKEIEMGVNAGNAAKEAGVQQVVVTSMDDHTEKYKSLGQQLPEAEKGHVIPMHESKTEIAAHLRTLGFTYFNELWMSAFYENYTTFTQYPKQDDGSFVVPNNIGTKPQPMHAVADLGSTAAVIFANPEKYNGQAIPVVAEYISITDICAIISEVTGKTVRYHHLPDETVRKYKFPGALGLANMAQVAREIDPALHNRDPSKVLVKGQSFREWAFEHKEEIDAKLKDKTGFLKDFFTSLKISK